MANKLDGVVTLIGDLETIGSVAAAEGSLQWLNDLGAGVVQVFVGAAAPSGTLGGRVTGTDAFYIRYGTGVASTLIYVTANTGTLWTAIAVP